MDIRDKNRSTSTIYCTKVKDVRSKLVTGDAFVKFMHTVAIDYNGSLQFYMTDTSVSDSNHNLNQCFHDKLGAILIT